MLAGHTSATTGTPAAAPSSHDGLYPQNKSPPQVSFEGNLVTVKIKITNTVDKQTTGPEENGTSQKVKKRQKGTSLVCLDK